MAEMRALDGELDVMDQALADRLDINRTDSQCLDRIARKGEMTPGQLADALGLTAGAITASLDRLEARGFIVRSHDEADRRRVLVRTNPRAHAAVHPLFDGLVRASRELLDTYNTEQLTVIDDFLRHTIAMIRDTGQRIRTGNRVTVQGTGLPASSRER